MNTAVTSMRTSAEAALVEHFASLRTTLPRFTKMPPPRPAPPPDRVPPAPPRAKPSASLRPLIFTVAPGASMKSTRCAPPPLSVSLSAPGPTIVSARFTRGHRRALSIRAGRRASVLGRLLTPDRNPVAGANVCVLVRNDMRGAGYGFAGALTTGPDGRFKYMLPAGPSPATASRPSPVGAAWASSTTRCRKDSNGRWR